MQYRTTWISFGQTGGRLAEPIHDRDRSAFRFRAATLNRRARGRRSLRVLVRISRPLIWAGPLAVLCAPWVNSAEVDPFDLSFARDHLATRYLSANRPFVHHQGTICDALGVMDVLFDK